eukprot:CAMPEP_0176048358 /NCGR_PEP_ID=MMETSP0120_2-20121206/24022_1 /TAXON_ID=160619 /ORGANISM="Kryptoperidinium foliaceum, Strain CCMP 1326" /LENGTH=375 /DNA_ID=CAMNT_0017381777 /DNA_START=59 /DNA_END=1186 /DNA_ORIENTATION=-
MATGTELASDGPPDAKAPARAHFLRCLRALALGGLTITLSVTLLSFNKILMKPANFPHAAFLGLLQMGFCSVFSALLFFMVPSLFPSLTDSKSNLHVDIDFVLRGVWPVGVAFAGNLVCANMAFTYLSIAFLQMMKEMNMVLVYFFSLVASLERFSWWHIQVITFAMLAASLSIEGELHFSGVGFSLQIASQLCECTRIVAMGVLLSGRKLDPMSCVLLLSPACFTVLGISLLGVAHLRSVPEGLAMPTMGKFHEFAPLLLLNCCLACALNVSMTLMIKYTSAVGYIFMGVVKDIVAVCVSVVALHEDVSRLQRCAFAMQILAVLTWSSLKTASEEVQAKGAFRGMCSFVALQWRGLTDATADEQFPLVADPPKV